MDVKWKGRGAATIPGEYLWPRQPQSILSRERLSENGRIPRTAGKRFRNSELLTVKGGKITDVEVYFGWSTPHKAPPGGFVDDGEE